MSWKRSCHLNIHDFLWASWAGRLYHVRGVCHDWRHPGPAHGHGMCRSLQSNTPMVIMVQNEVWHISSFGQNLLSHLLASCHISKKIKKDLYWEALAAWMNLDEPVFFKDRDADTNGSQEPKHISSLTATDTWEHHWTALQRIAEGRVLFKAPMPMQLRTRALHILQPISSNVLDGSCTMLHLQLNLANTVSARIMNILHHIASALFLSCGTSVQDAQNAVLRVSRADGISSFRREKKKHICWNRLAIDLTLRDIQFSLGCDVSDNWKTVAWDATGKEDFSMCDSIVHNNTIYTFGILRIDMDWHGLTWIDKRPQKRLRYLPKRRWPRWPRFQRCHGVPFDIFGYFRWMKGMKGRQ